MTAEQRALIQKGVDDLRAAQESLRTGSSSFAVTQAYRAMMNGAEALLLENGLHYSSHADVISAFSREWVKTGRMPAEYYRYLVEAGDSRRTNMKSTVSPEFAEEAVRHAEKFLFFVWGILRTASPA